MKRNYSGKTFISLLLVLLVFSCKEKTETATTTVATHNHSEATKYTCPMHPQIVQDQPGKCPICGMDLVPMSSSNELHLDSSLLPLLKPVNEQVVSNISTITAESGSRIFSLPVQGIVTYDTRRQESISSRVAGRIERMYIKYNYQLVSKGQLIMEIYSPDLAAAQRELIYISRSDNDASLLQRAKQRLSLLGMRPAQINQVLKTGKPLYRVPVYSTVSGYIVEKNVAARGASSGTAMPSPSTSSSDGMGRGMGSDASASNTTATQQAINPTPVLIREGQYVGAGETVFTLYKNNSLVAEFSFSPTLAAEVKRGQKLVYHTVANPNDIKAGSIGLIIPTLKNGESFTVARVYLSGTDLKPGQLLTANIPIVKNGAYWLPQNAVLQLGTKAVVFKKENNVFVPKQVQTGIKVNGMVEIKDFIGDWQIAKNASFLVDNESFIKLTSSNSK
jgi:multidrug efflux pump subunit AcrA (membrane-fusion protein)